MEFDAGILNDAQRAAMEDTEGYVLVLAGAGSGKTRVLTHRIAYLVKEKCVAPWNILAITFTNKATEEMKARLNMLLGENNKVFISTFHSLCSYILKVNAESLEGYSTNFSIYDESDSLRTIKKVLKEKNLESSAVKDVIKYHIGTAKNKGMSPVEYFQDIRGLVKYDEEIFHIYSGYEKFLRENNAMDFDDLLYKTKELFLNNPDILEKYSDKFHYIHVDEFQDTNAVQFEIVELLSKKRKNLFVVGDDDQSIYGWRGADIKNILSFEKKFPGTKVHKLLQNYRSTSSILECANNVIRNNVQRHEKELYTANGKGVRVEYLTTFNDYQEADYVLDTIISLKRYNGYTNSDFAILVRQNSLSRLFENKLSSCRLNYKVMGGFRFFDRKEIQDVIAYLRFVNNPKDVEACERIINFPRRGIGDTTVEKLVNYSRNNNIGIFDVIKGVEDNKAVTGQAVKKLTEFAGIIEDIMNRKSLPVNMLVEYTVNRAGFEYAYTSTGKDDDTVRWENIQEFLRHSSEFTAARPEAGIDDFLQTLTLVPERRGAGDGEESVTIATMHAVKGLEFKVVFIVGCEEEIFPAAQSIKEGGIEEERRVMYVAITRAKERLYITSAKNRFRFNKQQQYLPSRFINEAKGKTASNTYEEYEERRSFFEDRNSYKDIERQKSYANSPYNPDFNIDTYGLTPRKPDNMNRATAAFKATNAPKSEKREIPVFKTGDKVLHPSYGEGTVILLTGFGADTTATVVFPTLGIKKFKVALAPIKPIK